MKNIFKTSKSVSLSIDDFFDKIDLGTLHFKKGIQNYIDGNLSEFALNLKSLKPSSCAHRLSKRSASNEVTRFW